MMRTLVILCWLLTPLYAADPHAGHGTSPKTPPAKTPTAKEEARVPVEVPPETQAKMGIKTVATEKKQVEHTIRTVGVIAADQTREAHVHTKINGWIERLSVDFVGKPVKKGQVLYELYSPELVATQEEHLAARRQGAAGQEIAQAALDRLKLWGVPFREISAIQRAGKAKRTVAFDSPADGFVIKKTAIQGMYITPEMELYHIADLSRVWIILTLYEYDVAVIAKGDQAAIELPYDPTRPLKGTISYVYPEIDIETRTAKARIELENKSGNLKPGMFANVEIKKGIGEAIIVPDDSVIDTGTRKIVFVKKGNQFAPREVLIGPRVGESFAVLAGLSPGDEVVTSSHFLIDAESKLQAAIAKGASGGATGHAGHGEHEGKK